MSTDKPKNPLRRGTLIVFLLVAMIFAYALVADRMTPFGGAGRVQAYIVRVATEVPGRVIAVPVSDNAIVNAGDELFRVDPVPFELAVARAEAQLERAGQSIGASTSAIDAAQAQVVTAEAAAANVRAQTARILSLVEKGIYAKAKGDDAEAAIAEAEAAVNAARANLEAERRELGPEGADNPAIRDATAALEQARLDLSRTLVVAPARGVVTGLDLAVGQVVGAGQPALTFIDAGAVWIEVDMRENNLGLIDKGDFAELVLDSRPGEIFTARVESIGWGVAGARTDPASGLPVVQTSPGWLSEPQRFPVRLVLEGDARLRGMRFGARASVIIYAEEIWIMDMLAWLHIRAVSILTYVS